MSRQPASGRLAGRGCVVTGATGIAGATVARLAAEGARTFAVSIDESELKELADRTGCEYAVADLGDESQAEAAFASARRALERLDAVVAVAGGSGRRFGDGPVHDVSLAAWEATLRLNLTTTFLAAREAVRAMRGHGGSIVLTATVSASAPQPDLFATHAYNTAKSAVEGLVAAMAATYAPEGIRVNAVAPGLTRTPMSRRAQTDDAIRAFAATKQPLTDDGFVEPDDVAAACAYLCSDDARRVTGQVLAVDAGWRVTTGRLP